MELFTLFSDLMEKHGVITRAGSIVDASFVDVPRQRNSRRENEEIRNGHIPEEWTDHKQEQKDTDDRWAKKNNELHFGYKDHVKADSEKTTEKNQGFARGWSMFSVT